MSANTLAVTAFNGTKNVTKQFNFINPTAADSDCVKAAVALYDLTNDTIIEGGIQRVIKTSLDYSPQPAGKQKPTLSVAIDPDSEGALYITPSKGDAGSGTITVTTNSDGVISAKSNSDEFDVSVSGNVVTVESGYEGSEGVITITVAETDSFDSATTTVNVEVGYAN